MYQDTLRLKQTVMPQNNIDTIYTVFFVRLLQSGTFIFFRFAFDLLK